DHLFFQLWAQGKLTKKQTAIYCAQHYHYVTEYLNWMAYEASQIPIGDVKAYLFENLGDEENPEDRHLDMLKDYVQATGSSRESRDDSPLELYERHLLVCCARQRRRYRHTLAGLLRGELNSRASADLFVPETVCSSIQLPNVEPQRRLGSRGASPDHNTISGFQRILCHPDFHKLGKIVQLERPALAVDVNYDKWMWVDEMILRDDPFDGHLSAVVVNTSDRMMHRKRENQG